MFMESRVEVLSYFLDLKGGKSFIAVRLGKRKRTVAMGLMSSDIAGLERAMKEHFDIDPPDLDDDLKPEYRPDED